MCQPSWGFLLKQLPCYCHTCGSIGDRLELIIDIGFSGLECLDPPPLGNVELDDAVRRIGHRTSIKGNIDPVNVLMNGTPAQVRKDAIRRLVVTDLPHIPKCKEIP